MIYKRIMWIIEVIILLTINTFNANHIDDTGVIIENFPYQSNSESYEENILLPRDAESGCLCRKYLIKKYVTIYDNVLCKKFPKDLQLNTHLIRIVISAISVLHENDFLRNPNLTMLQIEGNQLLHKIEPGTFNGLSNLVNLTITHNRKLLNFENNTFKGLTNLVYLKIFKNGFSELKDFTHSINAISLPSLLRVVIAQMVFPIINSDDFESVTNMSIENLNLITCKIEYFHPIALSKFRSLKVLGLGENNLNTTNIVDLLKVTMEFKIPLEFLSLYDLGFTELPVDILNVVAQTDITHISLHKNRFERIDKFPAMPKITHLDLSEVVALSIVPNAFELLPNIRTLELDQNQFSEVPQAALLPHLEYLDLSSSGRYFTLEDEIFVNMTNLTILKLASNNIRKLSTNTFYGLQNLKELDLRESKIKYIDNSSFAPLKNLNSLDLSANPFPTRFLVSSFFIGLETLEVLQLGFCGIEDIKADSNLFSNMVSLKRLGLENNGLKSIPSELLKPLPKLEFLNISNNFFLTWESRMFTNNRNFHTLLASSNKITNITKAMVLDFAGIQELDLHNNPFGCSCGDMRALSLIYRKDFINVFNLLEQHILSCTYPENYANITILDYLHQINETQICVLTEMRSTIINIILLVSLALTIIFLVIIIFIYRWHIRYWTFLTKLFLSRAGKLPPKVRSQHHYQYDAFVSYSNEDQRFVINLVNMLEKQEPYYKLCVYERDFKLGTVISESVLECLSKSRKTILIVSESYIKSQWCHWEVQVAENHKLFFENEYGECSNDTLVIVKLGDICMRNVSPMLKYLMKTRIYLQWDEDPEKKKVFWNKLRKSLTKPKPLANYIMMID